MQEVWAERGVTQVDVIAQALEMHAAFAAPSLPPVPVPPETSEQRGVELGIGVLSRWPIIATRRHVLPCTHRSFAPTVLLATVDHPCGLLHVLVSATEWEPQLPTTISPRHSASPN